MTKSIYASQTKPDFSIPDGKYPAILSQIIQIGSHLFTKNGKEWYSQQIILGFELPTLTYENQDGVETSNIKSITSFLSMNPSNNQIGLREVIDGLRGSSEYTEEELDKFDIAAFIGKPCIIELVGVKDKTGKTYQNISTIVAYTGEKLVGRRTPILVTLDDFANIESLGLPTWIVDKITTSKEYQELGNEVAIDMPEDIDTDASAAQKVSKDIDF